MTPDLSSRYLGFRLRSPLVASAGPPTGHLDRLARLDDAGVGAVVLPSLFEEQIVRDAEQIDLMLSTGSEGFAEAQTFFPDLTDYNTGPDRYLELIGQARRRLSVPVIASLNGVSPGGWLRYARLIEDAGASALELNLYLVAADFTLSAADVEHRYLELVERVRAAVDIPLAVKLSPYFTALPATASALVDAGVDGLVLFNRFYQPDIDLDTLTVTPDLVLSQPHELRLPLRWIAILRGRVKASLAATSGVHSAVDAAKAVLAGADAVMMTSALLRHGPGHVRTVESGLRRWMAERDYDSLEEIKGSVSQGATGNPEAYERANYIQTLASYGSARQV